jgi:phosphate:Na+ symporter
MFFGIKQFAQSLQSISGSFIRVLVNHRNQNLLKLSFIGMIVALFTQTSMGLSYMVLAYVNAGLLSLSQSLHMLLGAQIGFVSASWFFSVNFGPFTTFILLFLGFVSAFFGQRYFIAQMAKCFFGIGLVLLGMDFFDHINLGLVPYVGPFTSIEPSSAHFYQNFLIVLLAAMGLTSVTRSKLLVLVIAFSFMKSFPFSPYFSFAVVMGMAVGASIPQLVLAQSMSSSTKRTAFGYLFLEVLVGVLFLVSMESIVPLLLGNYEWSGGVGFSLIYTIYTLASVVIYFLVGRLFYDKLIENLVPEANYKEAKKLEIRGSLTDLSTALAIDLVEQELKKMAAMVEIQLDLSRANLVSRLEDKATEKKVAKYEKITDNIDLEVAQLIRRLMQRSMQEEEVVELQSFAKISDELESIADAAGELISYAKSIRDEEESLPNELLKKLRSIGNYLQEYYIQIFTAIMENTEMAESHERFFEKITEEIKELKEEQKNLAAEAKISSDANHNLFEVQSCLSRVLRHSNRLGEAVNDRHVFLKDL